MANYDDYQQEPKPAFGQWLVTQKDRSDLVGQLAMGALADRRFPRTGDPEAVRKALSDQRGRRGGGMIPTVDEPKIEGTAA
ncbi:hypothetical protein [Sphingomonas sp. Leaf34]|uniref:hypothetical protein n=1 Tax=Sphingomonas sp. Leaf34 TaxID=1736216 RepID=UPI0006FC3147|nr:hypothetical protein [Sphingomonas sp. Leaf34]